MQQQPSGSLFGGQSTAFGAGPSLFGSSSVSTAQPNMFGGSSATTSAFGQQAAAAGTSTFGRPGGSLFGVSSVGTSPSTFGTSAFGSGATTFGASTNAPVGTTLKFTPVSGTDSIMKSGQSQNINTRHICITAMKEYESKSFEELRMEDYAANRKGPPAGSTFGQTSTSNLMFGQTSQPAATPGTSAFGQPSTSLFGQQQNKLPFGSPLQATSNSTSLFGSVNTAFGQKPPAFGAATSTSNSFLNMQTPQASPFGQTSTAPTFGQATSNIFGQNTAASTAQKPFAFTAPTTQPQTSSLFGSFNTANQQKPGGMFGATPAFGASTLGTTSFGTSFGVSTATTTPATQSIFGGTNTLGFGASTAAKPAFQFDTSSQPTFGTSLTQQSTNTLGAPGATSGLFGQSTGTTSGFGTGLFGASTFGSGATGSSLFPSLQTNQSSFSTGLNTTGLTANTPATNNASSNNQFAEMLRTLPYGTSPLFQNDLSSSSSSPGSSQFTTDARTINQYKMQVKTQAIRRTRTANKSGVLFEQIEDEDSEGRIPTGDLFLPKKNVKKLVLKSRSSESNIGSPAISQNDQSSRLDSSLLNSTPGGATNVQSPPSNNSISDQVDNTVFELVRQRSSTTLPDSASRPNLNLSIDSLPSGQDEPSILGTPVNTLKCGLILSRSDYYTLPPLEEIDSFFNEQDKTCILESFTIGRTGWGAIHWQGPIDVAGLNLDELVHIRRREVIVYPDDDESKPPVGQGLNRPAQITLDQVWPIDKNTNEIIKDPQRLREKNWAARLETITLRMKATFKDYRPDTGSWVFCVKHFSKYGIADDDDDEEMEVAPVPSVQSNRQESLPPSTNERQSNFTRETSLLKLDSAAMDTTVVKPITAFTTSFEQMFNDFPKPEDYVYKGPTRSPVSLSQNKSSQQHQQFVETLEYPSLSKSSFFSQDFYGMRSVLFDEGTDEVSNQPTKKTRPTMALSRSVYDGSFSNLDATFSSEKQTTSFITAPTALPQVINITRQELPFKMDPFMWKNRVIADISSIKFSASAKVHFYGGSKQFITLKGRTVSVHRVDDIDDETDNLVECLNEQMRTNTHIRTHSNLMPYATVKSKSVNNAWNRELNQLVVALYGDLATKSQYEQQEERRNCLIDWLTSRNRTVRMPSKPIDKIIYYLCTNDVKSAIDAAFASKQPRLAILIGTGTSTLAKYDFNDQLDSWYTSGAHAFIDPVILSIYGILAGRLDGPCIEGNDPHVDPLQGLDWSQQLALRLLYQDEKSIEESISTIVTDSQDVSYHLIAQYHKNPWIALDYCTCTLDAWSLHQSLVSYGVINNDPKSDSLHASFAAQLTNSHIRWACFVALHIADDNLRSRVIHEVLTLSGADLSPQESKWLQEYLVIPPSELASSRAQYSKYAFDYLSTCHSLIDAAKWSQAHDLLLEHILPDLVINEDHKTLEIFLSKLRPQRVQISTWYSCGAHVYDVYLALVTMSDKSSELLSVPVNIHQLKCPTAKHAFAQSEMAQRIERQRALETNGKLTPGLPLPDDYALMELRLHGLQVLEDLSLA